MSLIIKLFWQSYAGFYSGSSSSSNISSSSGSGSSSSSSSSSTVDSLRHINTKMCREDFLLLTAIKTKFYIDFIAIFMALR